MADKERVKVQTIICTRVATILDEMTKLQLPWVCQTTATSGKQASFLRLAEVQKLLKHTQVKQKRGVQCSFWAPLRQSHVTGLPSGEPG